MKYGNYRPKRKFRLLTSPLTLVVAIVACGILAKATWSIHQKAVVSEAKLSQAQSELAKLQARQADLQSQVSYLSTDQGIEAELRTKYHAVKDGESVAVIVDDKNKAAVVDATSTEQVSWWRSFLSFFGL